MIYHCAVVETKILTYSMQLVCLLNADGGHSKSPPSYPFEWLNDTMMLISVKGPFRVVNNTSLPFIAARFMSTIFGKLQRRDIADVNPEGGAIGLHGVPA